MAEGEQYSHPMVSFFSVLFKFSAIGFYVLCSLVIHNFVIQFVITILLVALDFWTVKNVSGRLLVGLRWWNDINEEGESVWHFESLDQESLVALSKKDSWLFWWSLYLSPVIWLGLGLVAIIKFNFDYLLVVAVALVLNIANIVGFTRCQKMQRSRFRTLHGKQLAHGWRVLYNQLLVYFLQPPTSQHTHDHGNNQEIQE